MYDAILICLIHLPIVSAVLPLSASRRPPSSHLDHHSRRLCSSRRNEAPLAQSTILTSRHDRREETAAGTAAGQFLSPHDLPTGAIANSTQRRQRNFCVPAGQGGRFEHHRNVGSGRGGRRFPSAVQTKQG